MTQPIPASHMDLITRPLHGLLTTLLPDGQPQSSLVWCYYEDGYVYLNTYLERQKGKNMKRDPRISLLIVDPENTNRFIQLRGKVELLYEEAIAYLNKATKKYTPHDIFYGNVVPLERLEQETRIACRIHAEKITLDAIHS